ncbi:MAG: DUF6488 family protein [Sulfurovum sp.]|nr:DUF6488 family protein [Sulfurovum sp.]
MNTLIKTTLIAVALTSGTIYAGSGHSHNDEGGHGHSHTQKEVSKEKIEKVANKHLIGLVEHGKIAKSWIDTPIANIEKKQFNHNTEWVVHFLNKESKDETKQTLYIFVSLSGQITGANHTGQ